uniref:sphingolipid 4-desaturase n=1 Tax=Ciona intestinalis TaxID=7719 RepID=F6R614_CIOIN|nr:sphingolipid delta(4)-desaturase DES1-like [Ciona intestinalis]|eukprot:XP_026690835.1 sphingolipid delta(4)-desaturase DES1-like [Ciona intestinalis]
MGNIVQRSSYEWVCTDEPHATRRRAMLEKYPDLKKLMTVNPHFKWVVAAEVAFQLMMCYFVKDLSWPLLIITTYFIGGTINHSLTLAVHELSHNRAFGHGKHAMWNRVLAFVANFPVGVPFCVSFKKYHLEHHRQLGVDGLDTDIPMEIEGNFFRTTGLKLLWVILQPLLYSARPLFINPKPLNRLDYLNLSLQILFNSLLLSSWGIKPVAYLLLGTAFGLGLHPLAGHFIAEHYMFLKGHETYSYYGPLNILTFNVGYHMEHHDFPSITGSKLPLVRKIAPDFYDDLPQYSSWPKVIYDFVTDSTIGPYSRIKRPHLKDTQ